MSCDRPQILLTLDPLVPDSLTLNSPAIPATDRTEKTGQMIQSMADRNRAAMVAPVLLENAEIVDVVVGEVARVQIDSKRIPVQPVDPRPSDL